MRNALVIVGIGAIVLAGGWWLTTQLQHAWRDPVPPREVFWQQDRTKEGSLPEPKLTENQGAAIGDENLVTFKCDGGKSIIAVFERDIVGLTLSDERQMTLRLAQSGSGIRYLSNDSKIEFRGKGSEGFLMENGKTTYANCIASN